MGNPADTFDHVVDVHDAATFEANGETWIAAYQAWLRYHGIDPDLTYRVEHRVETIRVHQYATNENGHCYLDPGGDIAYAPAFDLPTKSLPPDPPADSQRW